jgi:hypothetical protein
MQSKMGSANIVTHPDNIVFRCYVEIESK